uniref:ATP-dependent Clp protease proteolytic subunit n=1 Tax=Vanilla shenzhenica TaxID=1088844 RepID=A0A6B9MX18_9ASPA|nr:clpP-like protease [Vanilla shenzhenica]
MPVGVPKVPFQFPEDEEAVWTDLYNRLHQERILFLGDELDYEVSNDVVGIMVHLTIEDPTRDQFLFINCEGGWVIPGIGLYDTMQWVPPVIHTINMGIAASIGCLILVGGEISKRIAFPYARVMIHQPSSAFEEDDLSEFELDINIVSKFYNDVVKIFQERTKIPLSRITCDLQRDDFMSATEAQIYGIVDLVGFELELEFGSVNKEVEFRSGNEEVEFRIRSGNEDGFLI